MATKMTTAWDGCPVRYGLGNFGDKWSLLIIRDLMFEGRCRYNEFLEAGEGIATNILADRLHKLERNGIIAKEKDPTSRSRHFYSLTAKGLDLLPLMLAMIDWAERWDDNTEVPAAFIRKLRKDSKQLRQEILARLAEGRE